MVSTSSDTIAFVCLGAIAGAHGVRGELKVKTFTENPLDLSAYGVLQNEDGSQFFEITSITANKIGACIRLKGVSSKEAAQALKGTRLYVPRPRLPELTVAEDFYHSDLLGLKAINNIGEDVGTITAVHNFGSGDLLEIGARGSSFFIPFTKACVPEIDIGTGQLVIIAPIMVQGNDLNEASTD